MTAQQTLPLAAPQRAPAEGVEPLPTLLSSVRGIEGFPCGGDDAIVALSDPPRYTACPNPYLRTVLRTDEDERAPLHPHADDVAAGKNDPLYFAHFYPTKVPPEAIVPYILHFTEPGDVVFDGFCGTGMTGVAAQLCGARRELAAKAGARAGARRCVLSDLSPTATFIAATTNALREVQDAVPAIEEVLREVERAHGALLHTAHVGWPRGEAAPERRHNRDGGPAPARGEIEYTVWSDVFACGECATELVYWELVFRGPGVDPPDELRCPRCGAGQSIRTLARVWTTRFDPELNETVRQAKQVPVLINYRVGGKRFEKAPDEADLATLQALDAPLGVHPPIVELPEGFNTAQPKQSHGFTHVHHFFTRRNLLLMADAWQRFRALADPRVRRCALYVLTGAVQRVCRLNRYMPAHDRHVGPLSGTLYVSQLTAEIPATRYMRSRLDDIRRCTPVSGDGVYVTTQSATDLRNIPDSSVDYIFTDPPFGGNLNYSELNTLVEAWLELGTSTAAEAIVNDAQCKGMAEYQELMARGFAEFHRILKPGRWITIEFHNSQNAVWNSIQEAIGRAGFVVADVQTLDKKKGTTKQLSYGAAVKQDLVISAYKQDEATLAQIRDAGTSSGDAGVWEFVRSHLRRVPVFIEKADGAEQIPERQGFLLFDRMVAHHVRHGLPVPISAGEFYARLGERFREHDGMYFLAEQVPEYMERRQRVAGFRQMELFVSDEASAIHWARQHLQLRPQTFQELQPLFMREVRRWQRHERPVELAALLEENFLRYTGSGPIPRAIADWLRGSAEHGGRVQREAMELEDGRIETRDPVLLGAARDRWYVPDPLQAQDVEMLREKQLLKDFDAYRTAGGRKLKVIRTEAVRAGFRRAWQARDYQTIVDVARRIPEAALQEDPKLLMWHGQALTRLGLD